MEETDNKSRKSKGSFSIGKITKISSDFGKNHDQALLRSDVFESEKLCQRDHLNLFQNTTTVKMLNHHIILHVNCRKTDQQWRAVRGYRRVFTAQKMKFSIKDFFSIWSHMLMKILMENFIFCEVFARLLAVNYYHKALHLGCCSSPRSAFETDFYQILILIIFQAIEIKSV